MERERVTNDLATPGPQDDRGARLALNYVHGDDLGYGRVGAGLAAALRRRGVEVADTSEAVDSDDRGSRLPPRIVTWISSPFHALGCWHNQRPTLITMWETDRLPHSFRRTLGRFETILVPSDENLELFGACHPDVRRISFGVDSQRFCFTPRRVSDEFVFLTSGSGPRKGVDIAHAAFLRAFPSGSWGSGPRPLLVIKSPRNERYVGDRVQVIPGVLPAAEERALYDSAHCYVQASRGEGFGLQPLQAIAMGIPTILTDAHGHRGYAHLGLPVPARMVPSDLFVYGQSGHWWETDLDDLVDSMRSVYEHYSTALARAADSARVAAEVFTWDRSAEQLVATLGGEQALATRLAATGRWRSFGEPLYHVVTRRDFTINSAGTAHSFAAGQASTAPAHVKRLLFEAGLLDDGCIGAPLQALSVAEIEALPDAQRDEYLAWVVEAKRAPARHVTPATHIVTTTSAARTTSSVHGFGNSSAMSTPTSAIAAMAARLTSNAGSEPAE